MPKDRSGEKAIKAIVEMGHLGTGEASDVATFFEQNDGKLDTAKVADYLGGDRDTNKEVLRLMLERCEFAGMPLDSALRKMIAFIKLPGEAQKIDRIVSQFATRYMACNPNTPIDHEDTAGILAFSLVMLNVDAHNNNIPQKKKMTEQQYIRNLKGVCKDGVSVRRRVPWPTAHAHLPKPTADCPPPIAHPAALLLSRRAQSPDEKMVKGYYSRVTRYEWSVEDRATTPSVYEGWVKRSSSQKVGGHAQQLYAVLTRRGVYFYNGPSDTDPDRYIKLEGLGARRVRAKGGGGSFELYALNSESGEGDGKGAKGKGKEGKDNVEGRMIKLQDQGAEFNGPRKTISRHATCSFACESEKDASLWVQLVRDYTLDDGSLSEGDVNHVSGPPPSIATVGRAVAAFAAAGRDAAASSAADSASESSVTSGAGGDPATAKPARQRSSSFGKAAARLGLKGSSRNAEKREGEGVDASPPGKLERKSKGKAAATSSHGSAPTATAAGGGGGAAGSSSLGAACGRALAAVRENSEESNADSAFSAGSPAAQAAAPSAMPPREFVPPPVATVNSFASAAKSVASSCHTSEAGSEVGSQESSPTPSYAEPPVAGDMVTLDGMQWKVQYVSSKGKLDLRSADGDVLYGVDPAALKPPPAAAAPEEPPPPPPPEPAPLPVAGDMVTTPDGVPWKVQYVSSKGKLDLRSADGDVLYGVDPAALKPPPAAEGPTEAAECSSAAAHDSPGQAVSPVDARPAVATTPTTAASAASAADSAVAPTPIAAAVAPTPSPPAAVAPTPPAAVAPLPPQPAAIEPLPQPAAADSPDGTAALASVASRAIAAVEDAELVQARAAAQAAAQQVAAEVAAAPAARAAASAAVEQQVGQQEAALASLLQQSSAEEEALRQLHADCQRRRIELNSVDEALADARLEAQRSQAEGMALTAELEAQRRQLQHEARSAADESAGQREEAARLRAENGEARAELDATRVALHSLREEAAATQAKCDALSGSLGSARSQLERARSELEQVTSQIAAEQTVLAMLLQRRSNAAAVASRAERHGAEQPSAPVAGASAALSEQVRRALRVSPAQLAASREAADAPAAATTYRPLLALAERVAATKPPPAADSAASAGLKHLEAPRALLRSGGVFLRWADGVAAPFLFWLDEGASGGSGEGPCLAWRSPSSSERRPLQAMRLHLGRISRVEMGWGGAEGGRSQHAAPPSLLHECGWSVVAADDGTGESPPPLLLFARDTQLRDAWVGALAALAAAAPKASGPPAPPALPGDGARVGERLARARAGRGGGRPSAPPPAHPLERPAAPFPGAQFRAPELAT
ncbi:hypothetical protein OAO87_01215 [bacterium]|nr:hypothetical protein [bacterium]